MNPINFDSFKVTFLTSYENVPTLAPLADKLIQSSYEETANHSLPLHFYKYKVYFDIYHNYFIIYIKSSEFQ